MADLGLWTEDSKLSQFADDTQTIIVQDSEEELRASTIRETEAVVGHFTANNLANNKDKAALLYNSFKFNIYLVLCVCQLRLEYRNSLEYGKIGLLRFFPVFGSVSVLRMLKMRSKIY